MTSGQRLPEEDDSAGGRVIHNRILTTRGGHITGKTIVLGTDVGGDDRGRAVREHILRNKRVM